MRSPMQAHGVLEDMISGRNTTPNGIKSKELVALAARKLQIIEVQAKNVLGAYDRFSKSSRNRIWAWVRVKRASATLSSIRTSFMG